jgi:hypothetical protein
MDPRYTFRKGYDTDLLILRSLFALNSNTNQPISSFYTVVADGIGGIQWLSPIQYFSCATGILNFVSSVESFSTTAGLYSNFSTQSYINFKTSSIATYFISTQVLQLNSLQFLDQRGNSTQQFTVSSGQLYFNNALYYPPSTVVASNLISTVAGLGTARYISSAQLISTVAGLGANGLGLVNRNELVSTVNGLGSNNPNLTSTTAGIYSYVVTVGTATSNYASGVGTGASNYALTQATSACNAASNYATSIGSATSNYAFTLVNTSITSTTAALGIPSESFASTVIGLGTAGYISSSQLQSTIAGLGGAGLISSGQLQSTVVGLGGTGLISTGELVSTTVGLSNLIIPVSGITGGNLFSTVAGLGNAGYVSTASLVSTTVGLNNNFYVQNASQVYVNNSRLTISSVGTFIFFSTFMNSSITYQGNNGNITASNAAGATAPFYFSSAILNLDRWSSFINPQSIITLDTFPTFLFANNGLPAQNPALIFMSTFIQAGNNFTSSQMVQTTIYPEQYTSNRSNIYNQPMKLTVPGNVIQGFYPNPMRLAHYLPNALTIGTTQGFSNCNVTIFYGSTNSLFLSIQNLPL